MADESKNGRLSLEPVKLVRNGSQDRQGLESAGPGEKGANQQSKTSSSNNSLVKIKPESLPTGLQKKSTDINASNDKLSLTIDDSTQTMTINKPIFGTDNKNSSSALLEQAYSIAPTAAGNDPLLNFKFVLATIDGIGAKDPLEGLLAAQMMGFHNLTMDCLKRASRGDQITMDANINRATKLTRSFTALMEALNRHRGKIPQQMIVGNVNVNDGGRAIVGPVSHDSRGKATQDDPDKLE